MLEWNRKKLGMKILQHVFKKSKQSDGFKFEFQIENEVREIFTTWADEVVQNLLGSLEERWEWHRKLTAGDFLSLRHIRDQLPQELVEEYRDTQKRFTRDIVLERARGSPNTAQSRAAELGGGHDDVKRSRPKRRGLHRRRGAPEPCRIGLRHGAPRDF
ncbi:nuclear intron maturase 3, mitochondrial-like [Fagus crenata]